MCSCTECKSERHADAAGATGDRIDAALVPFCQAVARVINAETLHRSHVTAEEVAEALNGLIERACEL